MFTDVLTPDRDNNNSTALQKDFVEKTINEGAADFVTIEAVIRYDQNSSMRAAAIEQHNKSLCCPWDECIKS